MGLLDFAVGLLRPKPPPTALPNLHFKGPEEALSYSCKYLSNAWETGATLPAIIDEIHAVGPPVGHMAFVRISGPDGPISGVAALTWSGLNKETEGAVLRSLCAVLIGPPVPEAENARALMILATLEPTWTPQGWPLRQRF